MEMEAAAILGLANLMIKKQIKAPVTIEIPWDLLSNHLSKFFPEYMFAIDLAKGVRTALLPG